MAIRAYDAAIANVGCARELVLAREADPMTVACSATAGAMNELDGTVDWKGYYSAYGHTPYAFPGSAFTLTFNLKQDLDDGGSGVSMIEAVRVDWDFVRNAPISHVVQFGGNGAFAAGSQTTADATVPAPVQSGDCKVDTADPAASPSFATMANVARASLLMYADNPRYANSSTSKIYKRAKGLFHWEVTLDIQPDATSELQTINGNKHVRLYTGATTYYDIKWAKFKKVGEIKIPIEGLTGSDEDKLVAVRFVGRGASYVPIATVWTKGALTKPGGTAGDVWGA
jgi:hypothetical protein